MAINRGKQFEDNLRKQFEQLPNTLCLRLYDITMGYKHINNPCDLIVYRQGTLNMFELKAIHGNCLNFKSHIRDNQWQSLLNYSYIGGVNAGIICWFIDNDVTVFLDIQYLQYLKEKGYKSVNINKDIKEISMCIIKGRKKRLFYNYDLEEFLEAISYE